MTGRKDDLLKQLPDYLKGSLSSDARAAFEQRLADSENRRDIEGMLEVWRKLQQMQDAEPGAAMSIRFEAMLEAYKAGQAQAAERVSFSTALNNWLARWWPRQPAWQFGFAMALLLCGLLGGYVLKGGPEGDVDVLRSEVYGLRQMLTTSLLQSQSPAERLRGVGFSHDVTRPSEQTLEALLNTLNYDPNLNVRLAAVDALALYYDRDEIRQGILASLERQTSPILQIALIDLLVERGERRSVKILKELRQGDQIDEAVKIRAGRALERLQ